MVIVSLPTVTDLEFKLSKTDYTIPYNDCQQTQQKNTLDYNYITTEEYIQSIIDKYQDIIP